MPWVRKGLWMLVGFAGSLLVGWALAPPRSAPFLDLQARSPALHSRVLVLLPLFGAGGLGLATLARALRRYRWLRQVGTGLALTCFVFCLGVLGYVLAFDQALEAQGLVGVFERESSSASREKAVETQLGSAGPVTEDENGPGLVLAPNSASELFVLDRRTISRQSAQGVILWDQPRPVGTPASLALWNGQLLLVGVGSRAEDDATLLSLDPETGRRNWAFHALGERVLPPAWDGSFVALAVARPQAGVLYLLDPVRDEVVWRKEFDQSPQQGPWFSDGVLHMRIADKLESWRNVGVP